MGWQEWGLGPWLGPLSGRSQRDRVGAQVGRDPDHGDKRSEGRYAAQDTLTATAVYCPTRLATQHVRPKPTLTGGDGDACVGGDERLGEHHFAGAAAATRSSLKVWSLGRVTV